MGRSFLQRHCTLTVDTLPPLVSFGLMGSEGERGGGRGHGEKGIFGGYRAVVVASILVKLGEKFDCSGCKTYLL